MPSAVRFVDSIIGAVSEGKSVLLEIPECFPWYNTMFNQVKEKIRASISDRSIECISPIELSDEGPGEYLRQNFCSEEVKLKYRHSKGYPAFFAENETGILTRVLWIRRGTVKWNKAWYDFIDKYNSEKSKNDRHAVFVLELPDVSVTKEIKRSISVSLSEGLNGYDSFLFNMFLAAELNEPTEIRQYLAELASSVGEMDIELNGFCLSPEYYKKFMDNPFETIGEIADSEARNDGKCFEILDEERVKQNIIKAQIKVFFPLLEDFRIKLIKRYYDDIKKANLYDDLSHKCYDDPYDVELRSLYYAAGNGQLKLSGSDKEHLSFFRDVRNDLAHLNQLKSNRIREMLKYIK